jgi:hypothetical protein
MMIEAPWTEDQVESLNGFQTCGFVHPFTGSQGPDGERFVLIATLDGWVEREGGPIVQRRSVSDFSASRADERHPLHDSLRIYKPKSSSPDRF